jgi:hypothetical protein
MAVIRDRPYKIEQGRLTPMFIFIAQENRAQNITMCLQLITLRITYQFNY